MDSSAPTTSVPWLSYTKWTTTTSMTNITNNSKSHNWTNSEDCPALQFQGYIPWDNEDNLVSDEVQQLFEKISVSWCLPILFVIGSPANLINMMVFSKQGLKERINVCLFALSLADELYLTLSFLIHAEMIIADHTHRDIYGGPMTKFLMNNNLPGLFGFMWVSQVISAIIASERCFCIISPLHSQALLQTRTTVIFITACFIVITGMCFFLATKNRVMCVFNPFMNSTMTMIGTSEFYHENQQFIDILDSVVYGALIPGLSVTIVVITTIVTAIKLRQVVARRAQMSSSKVSPREVALTRMLIANSILFIVCVLPVAVFRFSMLIMPEIHPGRRHHNTYLLGVWVASALSYINSTFNFLIYHSMGSRYRATFKQLCCCKITPIEPQQNTSITTTEIEFREQRH